MRRNLKLGPISIITLFAFVIAIIVIFMLKKPAITGLIVYGEAAYIKNWTFDKAEDYIFDSSLISISDGEAKLARTVEEQAWSADNFTDINIESALEYEPEKNKHNRTGKVRSIGDGEADVHKDKDIFDVTFEKNIANGDIISLYVFGPNEDSSASITIYLCGNGTFCNDSNYGLISFNGSGGWYNITVVGLNSDRSSFNLDPAQNVKFDYIKAVHKDSIAYNSTNISYPKSASIETKDFNATGLLSFSDFTKNEILNNQIVTYYYSTDSGSSWNALLGNVFAGSEKFRVMANLSGNGTETPVVYDFAVLYSTKVCNENWNVTYGTCMSNDRRLKYYIDKNNCGTLKNIPIDNGTYEICDYDNNQPNLTNLLISPKYGNVGILVNISLDIEDESEISSAIAYLQNPDEKDVKTLILVNITKNNFFSILSTESLSEGSYLIDAFVNDSNNNMKEFENIGLVALASHAKGTFSSSPIYLKQNEKYQLDAKQTTNAMIELKTKSDIADASISIAHYSKNLYNSTVNLTEIGRYLDIVADNKTSQSLSSATIRIYYTDEEISSLGIDENTIKINYFNETGREWQALNSSVNISGNYVEVILDHLSTFGIFGDKKSEASASSGGSSGSGSPGGGTTTIAAPVQKEEPKQADATQKPAEEVIESVEEEVAQEVKTQALELKEECNYKISVLLPEYISLVKNDLISGLINNEGNCEIENISIQISSELKDIIGAENATIRKIRANDSAEFLLIKRFTSGKAGSSLIQGFSVKTSAKSIETYNGSLTFVTDAQNKSVEEKVNVRISIEKPAEYKIIGFKSILLISLLLAGVFYIAYRKNKQKKQDLA